MGENKINENQHLVFGDIALVSNLKPIWNYVFQQVLIGHPENTANCVALCTGLVSEHPNLQIYRVKPGGLFSWMVPSPLSKLIARIPVSTAPGITLDRFYADNRSLCPSPGQLAEFLNEDQDQPCFMLNFFKYKSLWRILAYGMSATRHQHVLGSEMVWSARCVDPHWEEVAIFRYPTRRAFVEMLSRKNYQLAEVNFREKGWADTQLFVLSNNLSY